MKKIFWSVGEKSGDVHASFVLKKLQDCDNYGLGGINMELAGCKLIRNCDSLSVMGFVDVLKKIFTFWKLKQKILLLLKYQKPDLVVLVDFPGLNMLLAKHAHKLKIPVVYYICPKFWAWKQKRLKKIKKYVDVVASIFPFEHRLLQDKGIRSVYVGNPVVEQLTPSLSETDFRKKFHLAKSKKVIGMFPGSRNSEVKKLLPVFKRICKTYENYEFIIAVSDSVDSSYFREIENAVLARGNNYDVLTYADFLIVKSGTTTLEAALCNTPFIIVYIADAVMYALAKRFVKLNYVGLPNIIMKKQVVPELLQADVSFEKICQNIDYYLSEGVHHQKLKDDIESIRRNIGTKSASEEVSKLIRLVLEKAE